MNIDGSCLSIKSFLRDWDTHNLFGSLQAAHSCEKARKLASDLVGCLPSQQAPFFSKFGSGRVEVPCEKSKPVEFIAKRLQQTGFHVHFQRDAPFSQGNTGKRGSEFVSPHGFQNAHGQTQKSQSVCGGTDQLFDIEEFKLKIKHENQFTSPDKDRKASVYQRRAGPALANLAVHRYQSAHRN